MVGRFERERDEPLAGRRRRVGRKFPLRRAERRHYVRRFAQSQQEFAVRFGGANEVVFRHFIGQNGVRAIIAGGRRSDRADALRKELHRGGSHFLGRNDVDDLRAVRVFYVDRAADDDDLEARVQRRLRERRAHASARRVRQIADGVEVLPRRAGGDQNFRHFVFYRR